MGLHAGAKTATRLRVAHSDASGIIEASDSSGTLHQPAECVRLGQWLFIVSSVFADSSLAWQSRCRVSERMRPLTSTEDALEILPSWRSTPSHG